MSRVILIIVLSLLMTMCNTESEQKWFDSVNLKYSNQKLREYEFEAILDRKYEVDTVSCIRLYFNNEVKFHNAYIHCKVDTNQISLDSMYNYKLCHNHLEIINDTAYICGKPTKKIDLLDYNLVLVYESRFNEVIISDVTLTIRDSNLTW